MVLVVARIARGPVIRSGRCRRERRRVVIAASRDRHARDIRGRTPARAVAGAVDPERDRAGRVRTAAQMRGVVNRRAGRRAGGRGRRERRVHGRRRCHDDSLARVATRRRCRVVAVIAGVARDPPVRAPPDRGERLGVIGAVPRDRRQRGVRRRARAGVVARTVDVERDRSGGVDALAQRCAVADRVAEDGGVGGNGRDRRMGRADHGRLRVDAAAGRARWVVVIVARVLHHPPVCPRPGRRERIGVVGAVAVDGHRRGEDPVARAGRVVRAEQLEGDRPGWRDAAL